MLFGISAPAASRLAGDMSAFTLAGLLYLGAAGAVLPVIGRARPTSVAVRRSGRRLATAVVLGGAVGPALLAAGVQHAPAAPASLLLNLELVFTTLLAGLVFREHVGRRVVVGTVLVVAAGVVLGWSAEADLRRGAVLIAAACLCWGVDNCVTANLDELAPAHITFTKGVVAGGANLLLGVLVGGSVGGWPVVWALVVGAFGYGISITLWVSGARDLGAARGQLVFATAPFVGAIVPWSAFSDDVRPRELVSLVIAAVGVSFVLRSDHLHEHAHATTEHDHEHVHDDGHHDHHHDAEARGRHHHRHRHTALVHAHPHVPDLHHRHEHASIARRSSRSAAHGGPPPTPRATCRRARTPRSVHPLQLGRRVVPVRAECFHRRPELRTAGSAGFLQLPSLAPDRPRRGLQLHGEIELRLRLLVPALPRQPRAEPEVRERQRVVVRVNAAVPGGVVGLPHEATRRAVLDPVTDRVDVASAPCRHPDDIVLRDPTRLHHAAELVAGARRFSRPDDPSVLVDPHRVRDVDHVVEIGDVVVRIQQGRMRRVRRLDVRPRRLRRPRVEGDRDDHEPAR